MVDDVITGRDPWDVYVRLGVRAGAALDDGLAAIGMGGVDTPAARPRLLALAGHAADLATRSLEQGAEDLGRLAETCARCMELMLAGQVPAGHGYSLLAASLYTLRQAFEALAAAPSRPGGGPGGHPGDRAAAPPAAPVDPVPLRAARYELETLFPVPGAPARPELVQTRHDVPVNALKRRR